jgi:hypothetical protein
MKRLAAALDCFWFAPAPAGRLALVRIVIGLFSLILTIEHYSSWVKIGYTSEALFEPVGLASFLDQPLTPEVSQALIIACLLANVVFLVGWQYRWSAPVFAGLLLWVLSYRNSWSMIYHSSNLAVLHAIVLAFVPAADAYSVDSWLRRRSSGSRFADAAGDWRYGWPIRLICALTLATYFLAGVAKVAGPLGWSWATAEGLRSQIAADTLRKEVLGDVGSPLFHALYDQVWLFAILAPASLALELLAPLALLNRRVGRGWAVSAFLMHWGIYFLMGITFRYQLWGAAFAPLFDLERLPAWLSRRFRAADSGAAPPTFEPTAAAVKS